MNEETESKHTPGTWSADDGVVRAKFPGLAMEHVCMVVSERPEADSLLISAAPDLLAALETLLDIFERVTHGYPPGAELEFTARDKARAAIAKAKGGAE